MNRNTKIVALIFILFSASIICAQETPEFNVKVGGYIQSITSFGQINNHDTSSIGWGIRRARLSALAKYGERISSFVQIELTSFKLIDAWIDYKVSGMFSIKTGRFLGAGVRGASLTSATLIDITERAYSADQWAIATVGSDSRDFGFDFVGSFGDFKADVTLHNGNGNINIINKQASSGHMNGSFAISGMLIFKPQSVKGLETGAYYGLGNPEINEYNSYNAYLYYEPGPFRLKAELIGWTNVKAKIDDKDLNQLGYYFLSSYKILNCLEAIGRYESFDRDTDVEKNEQTLITVGATYSFYPKKWKVAKITAAYMISKEAGIEIDNDTFQLMMQLVF